MWPVLVPCCGGPSAVREEGNGGPSVVNPEKATSHGFMGWEDPLEKKMADHSSTLAWKIPWAEEPGRLQSMGP